MPVDNTFDVKQATLSRQGLKAVLTRRLNAGYADIKRVLQYPEAAHEMLPVLHPLHDTIPAAREKILQDLDDLCTHNPASTDKYNAKIDEIYSTIDAFRAELGWGWVAVCAAHATKASATTANPMPIHLHNWMTGAHPHHHKFDARPTSKV